MNPAHLRFRMNIAILITFLLNSALFIIVLLPLEMQRRDGQLERIKHHLETIYEQNREALAHAIYSQYREYIPKTVEKMRMENIVEIRVYDGSGKLLYAAGAVGEARKMNRLPSKTGILFSEDEYRNRPILLLDAPILLPLSKEQVGALRMVYDLQELHQETNTFLMTFFLLLGMMLLLTLFLLNLFFNRCIIRPLLNLQHAMQPFEKEEQQIEAVADLEENLIDQQITEELLDGTGMIIDIGNNETEGLKAEDPSNPSPEEQSRVPKEMFEENGEDPLPGIDSKGVLRRLRGNHLLLKKLLKEFCRDYQTTSEEVSRAVTSGNPDAVLSIIHTVKGIAGNLSANRLYESSLALEQKIRSGGYRKDHHHHQEDGETVERDEALAAFEASMQQVLETACQVDADAPVVEEKKPIASADFSELTALIRRNSPRAEACFNGLKPLLKRAGFASEAQQLEAEIGRFDFKAALKTLLSIEAIFDADGPNHPETHHKPHPGNRSR